MHGLGCLHFTWSHANERDALLNSCAFFRCDAIGLEDSLCKRVIVPPDETITKLVDPDSAVGRRDALARIIYSRLFDW